MNRKLKYLLVYKHVDLVYIERQLNIGEDKLRMNVQLVLSKL